MVTILVERGNRNGNSSHVLVKRGNYSVWNCESIATDRAVRVLVKHGNYLLHGMAFHIFVDGLRHDVADGGTLSGKVLHAVQFLVGGERNARLDVLHRFRGHGGEHGGTLIVGSDVSPAGETSGHTVRGCGSGGSFGVELRHHGFMFLDSRRARYYTLFLE